MTAFQERLFYISIACAVVVWGYTGVFSYIHPQISTEIQPGSQVAAVAGITGGISMQPPAAPPQNPTDPTELTAANVSYHNVSRVLLAWKVSFLPVQGYWIVKSPDLYAANWTLVAKVDASTLRYVDTSTKFGTMYYQVRTNYSRSNIASVMTRNPWF